MPVHFTVATHPAKPFPVSRRQPVSSASDLLARTWGRYARPSQCAELLQSSLPSDTPFDGLLPQSNGFVHTVLEAYNQHRHLIIRPDDVWMAILSQFNLYVNANAEDLRSHFVHHEGKKELRVRAVGTRYTVDFGKMAQQMTERIDEAIIDKDLRRWILPDFTTTTSNDTVICAVFMMATLKAYFSYTFELTCGIPSVTLEGDKSDWEKILRRIDKLAEFGKESETWASLLRPILARLVQAFDGDPDIDFWGRVCHLHNQGSGPTYLSGWLTAFCVWNKEGKWQGPSLDSTVPAATKNSLVIDGVQYGKIDSDKVAPGYCEVDVKLDDNGKKFECVMVAGHCGTQMVGDLRDGVRPFPSWFMFIKGTADSDSDFFRLR